jgi:periplasmic divalent cation tolerance protein
LPKKKPDSDEALMTTTSYAVVSTTVASDEDAREIAGKVLSERLAACAQLVEINSLYTWKGAACDEREVLLLLKTRAELYPELERAILSLHKYETPEIVMLPVAQGLPGYLAWIDEVTGDGRGLRADS